VSRKNLLIGAGRDRKKKLRFAGDEEAWVGELVTVDMNPQCGADVLHDMGKRPFPFKDAEFDEIHAYDCLEHWGVQGDWRGWFDEMAEYHRILKPGGSFCALVPLGADHFADPGHTRFFSLNHFLFLNQEWYEQQEAAGTSAADYRWYWKLDFHVMAANQVGNPAHHLGVVLRKPGISQEKRPLLERIMRRVMTVR
jgi:SAM-dependent methyltransferase